MEQLSASIEHRKGRKSEEQIKATSLPPLTEDIYRLFMFLEEPDTDPRSKINPSIEKFISS